MSLAWFLATGLFWRRIGFRGKNGCARIKRSKPLSGKPKRLKSKRDTGLRPMKAPAKLETTRMMLHAAHTVMWPMRKLRQKKTQLLKTRPAMRTLKKTLRARQPVVLQGTVRLVAKRCSVVAGAVAAVATGATRKARHQVFGTRER